MIWRIRRWLRLKPRTKAEAIWRVRIEAAPVLDDLTDEQIEKGVLILGKVALASTVTMARMSAAMARVARAATATPEYTALLAKAARDRDDIPS